METIKIFIKKITPFVVLAALIVSFVLYLLHVPFSVDIVLKYMLIVFSLPLWVEIITSMMQKKFGVDLVAGVALATSIIFGQYIAGSIVLLMLSGGEALESYAMYKARKSLSDLLSRMPSVAHTKTENGIVDIDSHKVVAGTIIIVKAGEAIPIDGVVVSGNSSIDESLMTGEPMPVNKVSGMPVYAGTINSDSPLEIKATKPLSESRLEGIISLVRKAEEEKAPFVRMADTYSVYFTVFTFLIAGLAWYISGDPVRMFAVLVVATPCPLILATPIAFLSGMSRASRRGIIVKNGGALEALAKVDTFIFDKTGTVTFGLPMIHSIKTYTTLSEKEVIRLAASLDELSVHVLAKALAYRAKQDALSLVFPENFKEVFGDGVSGVIAGETYFFGKLSFLQANNIAIPETVLVSHAKEREEGEMPVYLGSSGILLGAILFKDEIRPEAKELFVQLKKEGVADFVLLSGDKENVVKKVAADLGITTYKASCMPNDKLAYIQELQASKHHVAMVGDGINDAPALACADVSIALGSHGETAASESADIVIVSGATHLSFDMYTIAKKTVKVAKEGILIGIGLSSVFMLVALFGYLKPFVGALVQEGIDIAVILYALKAGIESKK